MGARGDKTIKEADIAKMNADSVLRSRAEEEEDALKKNLRQLKEESQAMKEKLLLAIALSQVVCEATAAQQISFQGAHFLTKRKGAEAQSSINAAKEVIELSASQEALKQMDATASSLWKWTVTASRA
ncbi:hypothetical protein Slin15195_G126710 [Septoria linicola]|uniref:Uncharacterized protein n=1 Tax=Septoria linicola TaxID=215465 RepID=A0A9Q9B8P6_9PEZI|nr:hypothetical protein Slin15195_G126710 [Septoria linicola]